MQSYIAVHFLSQRVPTRENRHNTVRQTNCAGLTSVPVHWFGQKEGSGSATPFSVVGDWLSRLHVVRVSLSTARPLQPVAPAEVQTCVRSLFAGKYNHRKTEPVSFVRGAGSCRLHKLQAISDYALPYKSVQPPLGELGKSEPLIEYFLHEWVYRFVLSAHFELQLRKQWVIQIARSNQLISFCTGGVLFSLEEGASFWNQFLTWRIVRTRLAVLFNCLRTQISHAVCNSSCVEGH